MFYSRAERDVFMKNIKLPAETKNRPLSLVMGHANYSTTVSYTHILQNTKQKEVAKVGNFLN